MTKHIMEPPPPLRTVVPELPEDVCALVHEMLAKAPKERPSMSQVVIRLEQILAQDPELSTGDWRSVHRSRLTVKRRPTHNRPLVAAVTGFVLLSCSLVGIGVYRRAHRRPAATVSAQLPSAPSPATAPTATAVATLPATTSPERPGVPSPPTPSQSTTAAVAAATPDPVEAAAKAPSSKPSRKKREGGGAKPKAKADSTSTDSAATSGSDIPILR